MLLKQEPLIGCYHPMHHPPNVIVHPFAMRYPVVGFRDRFAEVIEKIAADVATGWAAAPAACCMIGIVVGKKCLMIG